MCASAPDTSRSDANAARMADLSEEQFAWVKQQWEADAPNRDTANKRAGEVSDAQLEGMREATQQARDYAQYRRGTFEPLEKGIVADARNFNTDAEQERLAGRAGADVSQSFDAARGQLTRDLGRAGVNPSDGKMLAMQRELSASQALGTSFAKNKARQDADIMGRALKFDAASMGRGLPSAQATQAGIALSSGNSSVNSATIPGQVTAQGVNMVNSGANMAMNGLQGAGNIYSGNEAIAADVSAANSQGTGQLAGAAMTAAAIF